MNPRSRLRLHVQACVFVCVSVATGVKVAQQWRSTSQPKPEQGVRIPAGFHSTVADSQGSFRGRTS